VVIGCLFATYALCTPAPAAYADPADATAPSPAPSPKGDDYGKGTAEINTDGNDATLHYHLEDDGIPMTNTGAPQNKGNLDNLGQLADSEAQPSWGCQLYYVGGPQCMCGHGVGGTSEVSEDICEPGAPGAPATPPPPAPPVLTMDDIIHDAETHITLPDGKPVMQPNPANNEWNALAIGFPIWLITDTDRTQPVTTTYHDKDDDITLSFDAHWISTTFDMDETGITPHTVTCTEMATRPATHAAGKQKSPDCGYTYQHKGTYTITATSDWLITWSAPSKTGTFTMTSLPATTTLKIIELHAVNVDPNG
jgi:hypothetical protein